MWFKKTKNLIIAIGAAVLFVTALVLLIWGVTHQPDTQLLRICWSGDIAHYQEGTPDEPITCERPEELVWEKKQIPLTITPITPDGLAMDTNEAEVRILQHKISSLNQQLSCELYRLGDLQSSTTKVVFGSAFEIGGNPTPPPGYTKHTRVNGGPDLRGLVVVRSDIIADDQLLSSVLEHELLHLAGLAHNYDNPNSSMFPFAPSDLHSSQVPMRWVLDHDIDLLRTRYCQDN